MKGRLRWGGLRIRGLRWRGRWRRGLRWRGLRRRGLLRRGLVVWRRRGLRWRGWRRRGLRWHGLRWHGWRRRGLRWRGRWRRGRRQRRLQQHGRRQRGRRRRGRRGGVGGGAAWALVGHGPSGPTGTFVRRSARSLGEVISTDQIIKIVKYLVISAGFKGKAYLHLCVASLFVSRELKTAMKSLRLR